MNNARASARILIVDDEPDIRELISDILGDEGHAVLTAANAGEAREARSQQQPDLILLDVWMPGTDGISLLREWRDAGALDCPVVMISGHGSVETAVEATRLGAFDFIEKPVSMARLLVTVNNALSAASAAPEPQPRPRAPAVFDPIGRSLAVQQLKRRLERIAAHDAPVLISGETGVGKDMAARWIHAHSRRAQGPYIAAPASAGDTDWVALLGGADGQTGLLAQADGGLLFIDDILRLELAAQRLLLAVLESGQLKSGGQSSAVDVRLVAAARPGLEQRVRAGQFEEALFYRLNVLVLDVPPLRERLEDVPDLVRFYAEHFPSSDGLPYRHFPVAVQNRLRQHQWPGNLRELKNLIQRLLVLGGEDEVSVAEVEEALASSEPLVDGPAEGVSALFRLPLREAREEFERQYLTFQLKAVDGSVGRLADVVEMERTHLYRKLRQLGIDPKQV